IYFNLKEKDWDRIKAKFYWGNQPKFVDYSEAFQFFTQIGEVTKEPECVLSFALSRHFDLPSRDEYLQKYLDYGDVLHREFAEALLNGQIYKTLPNHKISVLHFFDAHVRQGQREVLVWNRQDVLDNPLEASVQTTIEQFESRSFLSNNDLKQKDPFRYQQLLTLGNISHLGSTPGGVPKYYYILDPKIWELFRDLQVNEIEFVNCNYYEVRKWDHELETYKGIVDTKYETLLGTENKSGRYMNIYLSSMRIMDQTARIYNFYGGEDRLNAKEDCFAQFEYLLHRKLKVVDAETAKK
ncbi:MAG: hypothetical protein AAFV80_17180, partial [Bacteroidota bacterium]